MLSNLKRPTWAYPSKHEPRAGRVSRALAPRRSRGGGPVRAMPFVPPTPPIQLTGGARPSQFFPRFNGEGVVRGAKRGGEPAPPRKAGPPRKPQGGFPDVGGGLFPSHCVSPGRAPDGPRKEQDSNLRGCYKHPENLANFCFKPLNHLSIFI